MVLQIPNMVKLGLGNIREMKGISKVEKPLGYYTKMQEKSTGKDTMTGHWEIMGLYIDTPFKCSRKDSRKNYLMN